MTCKYFVACIVAAALATSATAQEIRDTASRIDWTPDGYRYDHTLATTTDDFLYDDEVYYDDVVYDADLFDSDPYDSDGYDAARYGNLVFPGTARTPGVYDIEPDPAELDPGFYEYDEDEGKHVYFDLYDENTYDRVQYSPQRFDSDPYDVAEPYAGYQTDPYHGELRRQGLYDDDWTEPRLSRDYGYDGLYDDYDYYGDWWDDAEVGHYNWWGTWDDAGEEGVFDF